MPILMLLFLHQRSERVLRWVAHNPLRFVVIATTTTLASSSALYMAVEKVTVVDALWWGIVTMATVGYGDIAPKTPFMRGIGVLVIGTGVFVTIVLGAVLTARITTMKLADAKDTDLDDNVGHIIQQLSCVQAGIESKSERDSRVVHAAKQALDAHQKGDEKTHEMWLSVITQDVTIATEDGVLDPSPAVIQKETANA